MQSSILDTHLFVFVGVLFTHKYKRACVHKYKRTCVVHYTQYHTNTTANRAHTHIGLIASHLPHTHTYTHTHTHDVFCSVAVEQVESAHAKPVSCSVLQCVAVCCSVLQCVAVCCSVLQCVAVCCSVLQCVAVCVAECCGALQSIVVQVCTKCVATHCNKLQHTATHCNTLQPAATQSNTMQHTRMHQVAIDLVAESTTEREWCT